MTKKNLYFQICFLLLTCRANVTDNPARPGVMLLRSRTANKAAESINTAPILSTNMANALQEKRLNN